MHPLTNQTSLSSTSKETGTQVGKNSIALVPVSMSTTRSGVSLSFLGKQYRVNNSESLPTAQLLGAQRLLLNVVQINGAISQSTLIALGQPYLMPLPQALLSIVNRSPSYAKKLQQLAKGKAGYQLQNAEIAGSRLQFHKGPGINHDQFCSLKPGEYSAAIKSNKDSLLLCLSPVQLKAQISLAEMEVNIKADLDENALGSEKMIAGKPLLKRSKIDVNAEYQSLFKRLGSLPTDSISNEGEPPNGPDFAASPIDNTELVHGVNKHFLSGALRKAGGLPPDNPIIKPVGENLATTLQRILPNLLPEPLVALTQPRHLKQTVEAMLQRSIASSTEQPNAANTHIGTIQLLLMLLLGRTRSQSLTPELAHKMQALQQQLGLPDPIMKLLEASASQTSFGKLLSNLNLYQQACSKNELTTDYYFALPYSLNHYQEQLEGHIQKEQTSNKQAGGRWQLRLKFNLANAVLLVTANMQASNNPQSASPIAGPLIIKLSSNNEPLLNRIELLRPALAQKIAAIGFSEVSLNTSLESIPASLLPGEHYLVKIQV